MYKSRTDFFKQKIYHFDLWKKLNVIKLGVPKKLSFWIILFRRKNCNSYTWKCFFYILHSSYKCCQIAYHRRVFRAPSNSQEWKLCKLRLSKSPECYFLCSRLSFFTLSVGILLTLHKTNFFVVNEKSLKNCPYR